MSTIARNLWSDWHPPDRSPVPDLLPLFPVAQLTPQSSCPHKTRIQRGSVLVCVQCHQSGQDHRRPDMPGKIQINAETGEPPRPEYARADRTVYEPPAARRPKLTRRQRRAAMRAAVNQSEDALCP